SGPRAGQAVGKQNPVSLSRLLLLWYLALCLLPLDARDHAIHKWLRLLIQFSFLTESDERIIGPTLFQEEITIVGVDAGWDAAVNPSGFRDERFQGTNSFRLPHLAGVEMAIVETTFVVAPIILLL